MNSIFGKNGILNHCCWYDVADVCGLVKLKTANTQNSHFWGNKSPGKINIPVLHYKCILSLTHPCPEISMTNLTWTCVTMIEINH